MQPSPPYLQLPCVVYLTCHSVTIDPADLLVVFSPSTFPALKVLSILALVNSSNPSSAFLVVDPLLWGNQLLALSMDWYDAERLDITLLSLPYLLLDWWTEGNNEPAPQTLPAHLRLKFSDIAVNSTDAASALPSALQALTAELRSVPSTTECRLKVLVLPRPFYALPGGHSLITAVQGLLKACGTQAVKVLYDNYGVEGADAVWLAPPSFIDYRRRKMRDEADREANEAANEAA